MAQLERPENAHFVVLSSPHPKNRCGICWQLMHKVGPPFYSALFNPSVRLPSNIRQYVCKHCVVEIRMAEIARLEAGA